MGDQRIEKWQDWMEHGVANDVFAMHHHRNIWIQLHKLIEANVYLRESESSFWGFLFQTYAKTQAVAVRRQADDHRDAGSLGRVMHEMTVTPDLITRDFWLSLWNHDGDTDGYWQRLAERQWEMLFGGGNHLDPAIPAADLKALQEGSERVTRHVDKHVAHMDAGVIPRRAGRPAGKQPDADAPARRPADLKLKEIHGAIDLVGRMFVKYAGFLTAATWTELTPIIQDDWETIFEVPWKPPRQSRVQWFRKHQRAREAAEEEDP